MVNSADQGFFTAVGVRFGLDVDTDTIRFDNTTSAGDNVNEYEHGAHTSENTQDHEIFDADSLTSSLEGLGLDLDHGPIPNLNHDPENASYGVPYFAGVRSVDNAALAIMAQNSLIGGRGANQQGQLQHHPPLGMQASWPHYLGETSGWVITPCGTHSHHTGLTSLPTNRSSALEGQARNVWSPSEGPSRYTSSATRPSGYDLVDSFGDGSTDFTSAISSTGQDDQFFGDESWLHTEPFALTVHETIGAQFDAGNEPSFSSVGLDVIGGQSGAGSDHQPRTTTVSRRDRRRSSMKGNLEFGCPEPGCGWTFRSQADLRHHAIMHIPDGGRVHACPTCSLRFRYPKDLERHDKDKHQAGTGFACPHCGRRFKRKDNLKRHQRSQRHQRALAVTAQAAAMV